jgi:hypothetical protein
MRLNGVENLSESELLALLTSKRVSGQIDEGIEILKENTGKGKLIDPSNTAQMERIFKVDSEFLDKLSKDIIAQTPNAMDSDVALRKLRIPVIPAELWTIEYHMQEIETKLRKFIESKLSSTTDWYEKRIPERIRKNIEKRIKQSSELLWFSEQLVSPLNYLTFPREYVEVMTDDANWKDFEPNFKHKAIIKGKMNGLGQIRNKIAHYRKISDNEKQMFKETVDWISNHLK